MAFTVSLPFDSRLAADDLTGSRAHVRGLQRAGILTDAECTSVLSALDAVEGELRDETFTFVASDEDIHTAVERRVTELAGPAGAKLHTGRSRNDQVATDLRLFTKRELGVVIDKVIAMQRVLLDRAQEVGERQSGIVDGDRGIIQEDAGARVDLRAALALLVVGEVKPRGHCCGRGC